MSQIRLDTDGKVSARVVLADLFNAKVRTEMPMRVDCKFLFSLLVPRTHDAIEKVRKARVPECRNTWGMHAAKQTLLYHGENVLRRLRVIGACPLIFKRQNQRNFP